MLRWFKQVTMVTVANLRNVKNRLGSSLATLVGVAGVVAVFIIILSMAEGFRRTMLAGADPNQVIVISGSSGSEFDSTLRLDDVRVISQGPGVARGEDGQPLASPEMFVVVNVPRRSSGTDANVVLRGVTPLAREVRKSIVLANGEWFRPAVNQFVVGRTTFSEFENVEPGAELAFGRTTFVSTGMFTAAGSVAESELWCNLEILQSAYHRHGQVSSVHVRLVAPESFAEFEQVLLDDPRLNVKVMRERDYYSRQSSALHAVITSLGTLIALLMGTAAVFGAVNTMYTAVSARTREIAILRSLGFGGGAVAVSVLIESLFIAALGGLLGAGVAQLFNGFTTATLSFQTFSQVAFSFAVTPELVGAGVLFALTMGFLSGILPAIRAARMSVTTALRSL